MVCFFENFISSLLETQRAVYIDEARLCTSSKLSATKRIPHFFLSCKIVQESFILLVRRPKGAASPYSSPHNDRMQNYRWRVVYMHTSFFYL